MAASATDLFKKAVNNYSSTLSSGIGNSDTSITPASVTNVPTDTGVVFVIDRVDANGNKTPAKREYIKGTVVGGAITNAVRGIGGSTAQAHSTGAVIECVYSQDHWNDAMTGILAHANQDGSLIGTAVRTALGQTAGTGAGWTTLGNTPNTVTANGNRSYNLVFNSADLTPTLSPGMRLQLTRTATAPTQCTSLNGTTQYYSKATPAGMTFTNNFVVSAWVKLTSYANAGIVSRYNGTSGWVLFTNASGQVTLTGFNAGASNFFQLSSYQSIPLNKWVHIAVQLDMTSTTNSPTVNYIMIDGVDVPATATRNGTNPTALVQAGNLEVGSYNAGQFFPGKIAQVAIYSAKVTEATILASMHQTLVGTETSLISAYSFNNSINDLNANANNLTANGSAVATSTDTPFTQTLALTGYSVGTTNFGIIQSATFSTNTTVVVQVPEGDTIPTSGGVSALSYSTQKVPYGFPAQRDKWTVDLVILSIISSSGTATSTVYNPGGVNLNAPIGAWNLIGDVGGAFTFTTTTYDAYLAVSSSASSFSDPDMVSRDYIAGLGGAAIRIVKTHTEKRINLAAATPYYLLIFSGTAVSSLSLRGVIGSPNEYTKLTAENAYL